MLQVGLYNLKVTRDEFERITPVRCGTDAFNHRLYGDASSGIEVTKDAQEFRREKSEEIIGDGVDT